MIDVVFLLLVFFMLASRFGTDMVIGLTLPGDGAPDAYTGPPRVVDVLPQEVRLNGLVIDPARLGTALAPLMETPSDVIVVRAREGAVLQRVVDTLGTLDAAGFSTLAVVN